MANPTVFISYSTQDQTVAGMVCQALEQEHIPCWIAPRNVPAGLNAFDSIPKGIEGCTVFVLVLSAQASQSDYVQRELQLALHYKKTIIPLRIEDIKLDGAVNFMLTGVQWLDAFVPPVERHIAALVKRVAAILEVEEQNNPATAAGGNPFGSAAGKPTSQLRWAMLVALVVALGAVAWFVAVRSRPAAQAIVPSSVAAPAIAPASSAATTVTRRSPSSAPIKSAKNPQSGTATTSVDAPTRQAAPVASAQTPEELRAQAAVLTGQQKMREQDYVSAENYFQLALNLNPGNAAARSGLASARKALGEE